ncbi:pyruvate/phosphate dikinase [Vibrio phage V-YDF132]|nr:pyruvate/phosphate dikinase [Vibrio phage V-YDF132]
MEKQIYTFGNQEADGDGSMTVLLGGKGAKLAEMSNLGINVPEGLTIPTTHCTAYMDLTSEEDRLAYASWLVDHHVLPHLQLIATELGRPFLVSVRSGARVSMAGMMDTVLNVGIDAENFPYWKKELGSRAAYDCLRRFKMMYANVVLGIDLYFVEKYIHELKLAKNVEFDSQLSPKDWDAVITHLEDIVAQQGYYIPTNLLDQLCHCVAAVFDSWNTPRAIKYREINGIPDSWGTAVNIQRMVFGNMNEASGSGVLFTSNPSDGEFYEDDVIGEYLPNAQGEDVVAGIRTPLSLDKALTEGYLSEELTGELVTYSKKLETHFNDMQDIEFTVENGTLYFLQTRDAKRTPEAGIRFAATMFEAERWDAERVRSKVELQTIFQACKPRLLSKVTPKWNGIAAGGGIVQGVPCGTIQQVTSAIDKGHTAIYVAKETEPDDIEAMHLCVGILTQTGGLTSHAAVVARGMNTTCVVGCSELDIQETLTYDHIAIDGSTGAVYLQQVEISEPDDTVISDFCRALKLQENASNILDITDMGKVQALAKMVEMLYTFNNIVLEYRTSGIKEWQDMLGKKAIPPSLLRVILSLESKKDKYLGKVTISVDQEVATQLVEQYEYDHRWFIGSPKTVADLLEMPYAKLSHEVMVNVFGSVNAAKHIINLLHKEGTKIAECYVPPVPALVRACMFLKGES